MNNLNTYRHWYLYCKNWYKKTDIVEDLKEIQSNWSGIDKDHISEYDVLQIILDVVWPHIVNKYQFIAFMDNQLEGNTRFIGGTPEDGHIKRVILSAKSMISMASVETISGELGEPDYSILPKKDDD